MPCYFILLTFKAKFFYHNENRGARIPHGAPFLFFSEFYLDMGGKIEFNDGSTPDFISANGSLFIRNTVAASGSRAIVTAKASGGVRRTLIFTQMPDGTLCVSYTDGNSAKTQGFAT
jgi:hypothetical protein